MKKLIVLVAAVLFIVGCGGGKNYYPLAIGNIWNFKTTVTTTMTTPDTTIVTESTSSQEITAEVTLTNGDPAFEAVMTSGTFKDTGYIAEVEDFVLGYDSLADTDPETLLVNPLEEGASWTIDSDSGWVTKAYVIAKEDSSVVVPAGTYDDVWKLYYVTTAGTVVDTMTVYIAPDVGQVKATSFMMTIVAPDTTTTDIKTELQSVTIK